MVPRLAFALLVVLAGCAGIAGDPADPGTTTAVPPDGPATTTDGPPSSPAPTTSTVFTPLEATDEDTVAYAELSATERRAFEEAVESGADFFDGMPHDDDVYYDPSVAEVFRANEFVLRNGTYYRLRVVGGGPKPLYLVEAAREPAQENATVAALGDLSNASREPVRRAIEGGSYTVPLGRPPPGDADRVDYVRYAGETYAVTVTHGDVLTTVVQAERWG